MYEFLLQQTKQMNVEQTIALSC